jgi:hypothetical protein
VEGYGVSGVALAVRVEEIGCVDFAVETECSGGGPVQDVADILGGPKVLDNVVQIAVVAICRIAALGAGERDGGHNVGAALGEVEEDTQEPEVAVVIGRLWCGIRILGEWRVWVDGLVLSVPKRGVEGEELGEKLGLSNENGAVRVV